MRVDELALGQEAPQLEQYALRLEPLAHGGRVEPGERPCGIPVGGGPAREPFRGGAAAAVAVAHLPVHQTERGGERRAEPGGSAISPGGRRHRGNVVAAGSGVNPAARSREVPARPRPRVRRRDLALKWGNALDYMHEVHVPPATEEVIHCLLSATMGVAPKRQRVSALAE